MQPTAHQLPFISVIIPAYNEANRLPGTLEKILDFFNSKTYLFEILVVDDGSNDGTRDVVQNLQKDIPNLKLIENPHLGKGATVKTGMLNGCGDLLFFSDADLSTPIEEVDRFIPFFEEGFDVVIGSREGSEAKRHGEPYYRHVMGRVFNNLVKLIAVQGINDTQCGFKAFKKDVAKDLFSSMKLYSGDQEISGNLVTAFDVEILFLAKKKGYRIKEVPIQWHYFEETKVHAIKDSWKNLRDVLQVRWNAIRGLYG